MTTFGGRFRAAALIGAAALALAFTAGVKAQDRKSDDNARHDDAWHFDNPSPDDNTAPRDNPWPYNKVPRSPVLAVVGDISCQPGETEPTGEKGSELCINPKAPYTTAAPYSLWQSQEATANQIENMKPDAVAITGDLQYQVGQYSDFEGSYDLTYGAFKGITRPSPGNHEFYDEHNQTGVAGYGYFSYFNGFQLNPNGTGAILTTTLADPCPASVTWTDPNFLTPPGTVAVTSPCNYPGTTTPSAQPIPRSDGQAGHFEQTGGVGLTVSGGPTGVGDGWYSYNLGSWHLISLNIECSTQPGACSDTGSWFGAELAWLKKDLEENDAPCTAAYWHQPTFSATNGISLEGVTAKSFWDLLYEYRADLVLNGHDHLYARYRPLRPDGTPDKERGLREIIIGTGGETLDPIALTAVSAAQSTSTVSETNQEDPTGDINFNAKNLQAYSGDYWGVMKLTLDSNGYRWDFESALAGPAALVAANGPTSPSPNADGSYSDQGSGSCHNSPDWNQHDDDHGR
jgi:acid phosphatase type 7